MLFGAEWAITGACPGPIYAQIGAVVWMSLLTLLGAIAGMYAYAYAKPRLPPQRRSRTSAKGQSAARGESA